MGYLNYALGFDDNYTLSQNSQIITTFNINTLPVTQYNYLVFDSDYLAVIQINPVYSFSQNNIEAVPHSYYITCPTGQYYNIYEGFIQAIQTQFNSIPDLVGTTFDITGPDSITGLYTCILNLVINQPYNGYGDTPNTWYDYLHIDPIMIVKPFDLSQNSGTTSIITNQPVITLSGDNVIISSYRDISFNSIILNSTNNYFDIIPFENGLTTSYDDTLTNANNIRIVIDYIDSNGIIIQYTLITMIAAINEAFANIPITAQSRFNIVQNNGTYIEILLNINKCYTENDYNLVFYDTTDFIKCNFGSNNIINTTWNTTLGWILGYHLNTVYILSTYINDISGAIIVSDSGLNTTLFNYFLITLDDFNLNHLDDGLVTITSRDTSVPLPSYANRTNFICDPATNTTIYNTSTVTDYNSLTQNQIYSLTQIANSHNATSNTQNNISSVNYGVGPFVKDVFGIIPLKTSGLQNGQPYVEFGGTLQNQDRTYFGPVTIHRMAVSLISDKGTIVDLNGVNWSFSFVCEQLYKQNTV
jgi:hypothetical protein